MRGGLRGWSHCLMFEIDVLDSLCFRAKVELSNYKIMFLKRNSWKYLTKVIFPDLKSLLEAYAF
jgi:hypothetical protein